MGLCCPPQLLRNKDIRVTYMVAEILTTQLVEKAEYLIGLLLLTCILLFSDRVKSQLKLVYMRIRNPIRVRFQRAKEIDDLLVKLRSTTRCIRAYVCEFHNGGEFARAGKIWRITCTYEKVAPAVQPVQDTISAVMVERLREWAEVVFYYAGELLPHGLKLHTNDERGVFYRRVDTFEPGYTRRFFEDRGAKAVAVTALYTFGMPTGMVCLDYDFGDAPDHVIEEDMKVLAEIAARINFYMERQA